MPSPDPIALPSLPSPAVADPLIGFMAEGITIETLVRVHAVSRTYVARRFVSGKPVALVVQVVADHLARDVAFGARFRREAEQLAALHHVHVETYLGHRTWNTPSGRSVLALLSEFTAGVPLSELVRRERLPVCDVLRLFHQACDGLAAAHRMGIVHGDLTPESILVTPGGAAKLRGFALGASGYAAERIEHSVTGSPEFMAPEVCRGQQPSSLSDLYSVGAVLVTTLTGDVPFPARTALECIHLQNTAPVPDLAASHPEFAALAPVIQRMMAKDPAPRWIAADELARELLVLSGQMPAEVRCRVPRDNRHVPLASLVQSALADLPVVTATTAGKAEAESQSTVGTSGGTTTISRKSTDFFRNPELYKPSGATPAGGVPILPAGVGERPTTRTVRREGAIQAGTVEERPATRTVRRESATQPGRPVAPATAPPLAMASAAAVPPPSSAPARSWFWPGIGLAGVLVVASGLGLSFARQRAGVGSPTVSVSPRPTPAAPDSRTPESAVPAAAAPPHRDVPPAASTLDERIAAIVLLGHRDPAAALSQADSLRGEHPTMTFAGLPLPLRLVVVGPPAAAVRVTRAGMPMALSPDLVLCRVRGQWLDLEIAADGFRTQRVEIPEGPPAGEQVQMVTLLNEARWSQPAFSPTWVRLFRTPAGIVVASDRKVVLVSAEDGQERARLDHALVPELPAEGLTWAAVQAGPAAPLQFAATGGLCLEAGIADGFKPVRVVHHGQASVLKALRLPLTLRLGEEGTFAIERTAFGVALVADSHQRRLWSRPLTGNQTPWFMIEGDHLLVVGDRQVQRFSQEGEELPSAPLPGLRSAEPLLVAGVGLLIPTQVGLAVIASPDAPPRLLAGLPPMAVAALVGGSDQVTIAGQHAITSYRVAGNALQLLWSQEEAVAIDRRIAFLVQTAEAVIGVEDTGVIRSFRLPDGAPARTVRPGVPLLTAPLALDGGWVVVEAPGVVRLY